VLLSTPEPSARQLRATPGGFDNPGTHILLVWPGRRISRTVCTLIVLCSKVWLDIRMQTGWGPGGQPSNGIFISVGKKFDVAARL
jgi:hypothetical protein